MTLDAGGNFTSACTAGPHIWVRVYPTTRRPFSGTGDLWFGVQCIKHHVGSHRDPDWGRLWVLAGA